MYEHDERIVMTLDAGGTNFVFSAIQGCREIVEPICLPAASDDLERCLSVLVEGFLEVEKRLPKLPVAISFAFPGPADYEHGIIGDLPNFPAFRGGVALGPYLREQFGIPVFIRISVSNCSSLLGAGGGVGLVSSFLFILLISLTNKKIEKAIIRKSRAVLIKLP